MSAIKGLETWTMAAPELFLGIAAMILLLLGVFRGEKSGTTVAWLAVLSLGLALALIFTVPPGNALNGLFASNKFVVFMKALVLLASMISLVVARSYLERENAWRFEYPVLVVLATLGMMLMMSANDLIALYLGLELQSLALYVIASFQRDTVRSTEAGLKYFVLGALSSGMLLYGASLIYGFAGTTTFLGIAKVMAGGQPSLGALIGLVFVTAGLAFKVSAVPFHMWTPDVYEGAPTPVTALFSIGPKIAAMSLFVSVMVGPFKPLLQQWQQIVVFIAIASMLVGAFAAIAQTNIKRLMAYSSIGHVGYVLLGVAAGNEIGIRGVVLYLTIYLFMNAGAFACILAMKRQDHPVENIGDLAGVSRTHPLLALAMAIFMFSMAGIPPLAGFFGKLYVFLAALNAGLVTAAVIGVVSSVVAAYYYLRIIKIMYFDQPGDQLDHPVERPLVVVMGGGAVITFVFGAILSPVLGAAQGAAAALFGG